MGNTVGDDRQRIAGHEVGTGRCRILNRQIGMVEAGCADIDRNPLVLEARHRKIGILQRPPGQFQHQPLLRIHEGRFAPRNAEQGRVEGMNVFKHPCSIGIVFSRNAHLRVPEARTVPAITWNVRDRADARTHHFKQRFRRSSSRCGACTPDYFYCHILLSQSFIGLRHDNLGAHLAAHTSHRH